MRWSSPRPDFLVLACSDGRLQEATGSADAMCADYRRKLPWASIDLLRERQVLDAQELMLQRKDWAGKAEVILFRCEVDVNHGVTFVSLSQPERPRKIW